LVESYLSRYQYNITNYKLDENNKIVYFNIEMNHIDQPYNLISGLVELTPSNIKIEINKELFNGDCCIVECLSITKDGFEGCICDFTFYNAKVTVIEGNQKQDHYGKICVTNFDNNGIKDENYGYIPYDSETIDGVMEEVLDIHSLNQDEIAETFDFDDYIVHSLTILDNPNTIDLSSAGFDHSMYLNKRFRKGRR
jgi:hypothetical protein